MDKETIVIDLGNSKLVRLTYQPFDTDIDMDQITQIDYSNIVGELLTVSALLNKVGLLKADVNNRFSEEKVDLDIYVIIK